MNRDVQLRDAAKLVVIYNWSFRQAVKITGLPRKQLENEIKLLKKDIQEESKKHDQFP